MLFLHTSRTVLIQKIITFSNIIGVAVTLSLLSDTFSILTSSLLHLTAIFIVLGIILLNFPIKNSIQHLRHSNPHQRIMLLGALILIASFLLLILSSAQLLWIASIPLLITGLSLILQGLDKRQPDLSFLSIASFGYAVVFLLLQSIPTIWYFFQQTSLFLTHTIGSIIRTSLSLGPTTSALWILLLFLVFISIGFFILPKKSHKDIGWFIGSIGGLLLLWILYIMMLSVASFTTNTEPIQFHPVFFSLCLIPTLLYYNRYPFIVPTLNIRSVKRNHRMLLKSGRVWAAITLLLSMVFLTVFINTERALENNTKVLFYGENMLGTWDIPEYGKYGKDGFGMFGLWPIYLSTQGYKPTLLVKNSTSFLKTIEPPSQNITQYLNVTDYISLIEGPVLTKDMLTQANILVITNLNVSFTPDEQSAVWDFVKNGGSLLVLGDHTNVGGIRHPLNELLQPAGISFRFDAALPLDDTFKWQTSARLLSSPITAPITDIDELQYGVGASLNITNTAFPIVIGTYALSDYGNQSSADIAYLGDYSYQKREQLGDIILVAAAYYGQGKVLVFGDTSSFQNPALPFTYPFLRSTFSWLASSQNGTAYLLQIIVSLFLLIGAILLNLYSKDTTVPFVIFPAALCIALILTSSFNSLLTSDRGIAGPIVSIDVSHIERFAQEPFTDESINGLILNLQRNNYLPILLRDFSYETISKSKMLLCNAPTASFTSGQVEFLKQYMSDGGFLVLATGYDDRGGALPLLRQFDITVEPIPLGPVPYVEGNTTLYQNEPRFVDSWPLTFPDEETTSYYNFTWDGTTYHLVIFEKYGAGGLLVIGDSQFLLDKNIESVYDYWPGNIIFIKHLINELQNQGE